MTVISLECYSRNFEISPANLSAPLLNPFIFSHVYTHSFTHTQHSICGTLDSVDQVYYPLVLCDNDLCAACTYDNTLHGSATCIAFGWLTVV